MLLMGEMAFRALTAVQVMMVEQLGLEMMPVGVQTEGGGVVDEDGTGLDDGGSETLGDVVLGGTQDDVDALEGLVTGQLDGHILALELHGLAHGAGGSQGDQLADGEVALFQNSHHFLADSTGRAQNTNSVQFHFRYLQIDISNRHCEPVRTLAWQSPLGLHSGEGIATSGLCPSSQ